jgi:hypothetical protein
MAHGSWLMAHGSACHLDTMLKSAVLIGNNRQRANTFRFTAPEEISRLTPHALRKILQGTPIMEEEAVRHG